MLGAGGALDASSAGRGVPSPGSAKLADIPVLALLWDTATLFTIPAVIAAAFAAGRDARWIAAGAAAWVAIVAVMTVAGYAGNPRYLVAAAALGAALAGVGAVRAATALRVRRARSAPPSSSPPSSPSPSATSATRSASSTPAPRPPTAFDGVLAKAGGKDALLDCSRIRTSNRARSLVAFKLDLPMRDLDATPDQARGRDPREVVLRPGPRAAASTPATARSSTEPFWQIVAACGRAPQVEPDTDDVVLPLSLCRERGRDRGARRSGALARGRARARPGGRRERRRGRARRARGRAGTRSRPSRPR